MDKLNFRYMKVQTLIIAIAIFTVGLMAANKYVNSHWGVSFSVFSAVALIFYLVNTYLWNTKMCKWMYDVADFSGRYEGTLKYEYRNEKCETITDTLEHIKVISQNGSSIVVKSFTRNKQGQLSSESTSREASITKEADGSYALIYHYLNEGNPELGFSPHYGTEVLKLIEKGGARYLVGRYYTERLPYGTKGKIELEYRNKDLHHEK